MRMILNNDPVCRPPHAIPRMHADACALTLRRNRTAILALAELGHRYEARVSTHAAMRVREHLPRSLQIWSVSLAGQVLSCFKA